MVYWPDLEPSAFLCRKYSKAITPESDDPIAHAHDLQRERCLLFVARTRARDDLYVSYSGDPSPFLPAGLGR